MSTGSLFVNSDRDFICGGRHRRGSGPLCTAVAGQAVSLSTANSVHVDRDDGGHGIGDDLVKASTEDEVGVSLELHKLRYSVLL